MIITKFAITCLKTTDIENVKLKLKIVTQITYKLKLTSP